MHDLFFGTGIAHSILLFAFVIGIGLMLGKLKVKGVTLGVTWILFVGILVSHFGFRSDPGILNFVKEFGLILFVFSIGLQVGPGFFHSFRSGGLKLNMLSVGNILLAVLVTWLLACLTGESLPTMVGVMSGAVTNTPGLGAAQQTVIDVSGDAAGAAAMTSAYAVAYPLGVIGVILVLLLLKPLLRVNLDKERTALEHEEEEGGEHARRMHCMVENPALFGRKLSDVLQNFGGKFVASRIMKGDEVSVITPETVLEQGDRLLIVTTDAEVDKLRILFGEEVPMHQADWDRLDHTYIYRRITVTRSTLTGKKLRDLNFRAAYNVNITRIIRAGVEIVATPNMYIQMGDVLMVVGRESAIQEVSELVGNKGSDLNKPNLIPIFLGIVLGVIFGSIPIRFPGIPQAVKLGLAGGPLIIAILIGYFGPKWRITTYTTESANLMIRDIGISLFLAAVGIGAGENFVSSLTGGGYWWILYGAAITMIPVFLTGLIARLIFKVNFYQIIGMLIGSTTNAPVLAFAQNMYGTEYPSLNYATVYPLSMFLRVLVAQLLILIAFA